MAPCALVVGVIDLAGLPEMVQQDGELSGDSDDRAFLASRPAMSSKPLAKAAEIAVVSERPEDVLSALHQQTAQIRIALLVDPELRVMLPRVRSCGHQPEIGPDLARAGKPLGLLEAQHVTDRGESPDALDLSEPLALGIALP